LRYSIVYSLNPLNRFAIYLGAVELHLKLTQDLH